MHSVHGFFTAYSIESIVAVISALVIYLLYRHHTQQARLLQDTLHVSSQLIDHPLIIFSDTYQVIYANEQIQKFIQAKHGDTIESHASFPTFLIDTEEKSLPALLDLYREKSIDDILYLSHITLRNASQDYTVSLRLSSTKGENRPAYTGMAIFDLKEQLELSKIHYQNITTGLPNHNKALADIGLMAHRYTSKKEKFAVAVISIDNFLEIISLVGYKGSLEVVSLIARYLQSVSLKNNLKLYHITSNNFLLILPRIQTMHESNMLVEKYKTDCEVLLHKENEHFHYTISSGISLYPDNGIETLITSAYRALLLAKKQGLGYTMMAKSDSECVTTQAPINYSEINKALELEEFVLYYQPIYDTAKEKITSAEALIRWIHPTKGIVSPIHFLPLIERTGFMKHLSTYVAKKVIKQLAIWKSLGFRDIQVSINLSLREFESMDYPLLLDTLLHEHGISTSQLKVEVTENIAMSNETYSGVQFSKLKKLGIDIALDDFGTGHSSFSMLKSLPIDTVKIDRSFIKNITKDKDHYSIVKAMIAMAHSLGIKVTAEGIEDKKTAEMLHALQCELLQGYYYGKPMPVFEFQELIRSDSQVSNSDDIIAFES